jgi:hypothetical protein
LINLESKGLSAAISQVPAGTAPIG